MSDIRKRTGAKGTTYQVRYADPRAKSGYSYASFETAKEARAFREDLRSQKSRSDSNDMPVVEAVEVWLQACEKTGRDGREKVEPETLKEYKRRAKVMKEYAWPCTVQRLRPANIRAFRTWLLLNKSRDLARRVLSSFHSVLIEMIDQDVIQDDPAIGVTIKAHGRYEDDDSEVEIPSDAEMRAILAAADRMGQKNDYMRKCWARYRPMIYLAAFSGMRPSEYRGLPWDNLYQDRVEVLQRADKTGIIGPVKSKAGRRTIYIPRLVSAMLQAWRKECPASESKLVFPTESGKPIMLNNFATSAWLPLMKEAGLADLIRKGNKDVWVPRYTPYALRHYFASKLIAKRVDIKELQETMGHSDAEITLNVYGHLMKGREDTKRKTAEAMAEDLLAV